MVSMLINETSHQWKESIIRQIFEPSSAEAILSIPLAARHGLDKLIWVPNSKGLFAVKSAYKVANPQSSQSTLPDQLWNRLWKINVPERIKMLLWRIAANTIPVKEKLAQRMKIENLLCDLCLEAPESSCHLFCRCPVARAIWFTSCWGLRVLDQNIASNADIVKLVLDPPTHPSQEVDKEHITTTLAFVLDEIWFLRNQLVFEDSKIDILSSSNRVARRVAEFTNLHYQEALTPPPISPNAWSPPPAGTIKLNVDAAVGLTSTTLAVIARDHTGVPIRLWAKKYVSCLPIQAEAAAVLWAINLASAEGWSRIIIEGDSKICFDALADKGSLPPWVISNLVCDVFSACLSFISVSFVWVERVCNMAAHAAAKFAIHSPVSSCSFFVDSLPLVLVTACKADFPPCAFLF